MLNGFVNSTASGDVIVICVEPWIGKSGEISRIIFTKPRSCTITASTPASTQASISSLASSSSFSNTRILKVRNPLTP